MRPAVHATPLSTSTYAPRISRRACRGEAADLITQHAEQVFEDLKRSRDTIYTERDRLEASLKDAYFVRYPFMRQAMQHSSELKVADLIAKWVRQGCPDPDTRTRIAAQMLPIPVPRTHRRRTPLPHLTAPGAVGARHRSGTCAGADL